MKTQQIKTLEELIAHWPFMSDAFRAARELVDQEEMFQLIVHILAHPTTGWVGVAMDSFGTRLALAVAEDATPRATKRKVCSVRFLYFLPKRNDAVGQLMRSFERWARENQVSRYDFPTDRSSGAAIACFGRFRLKISKTIFSKEL